MEYDKRHSDGRVERAVPFTYRVMDGVPVVFQLVEWALVIAGLQFLDKKFHLVAAQVAWYALTAALALYVGVLGSNVAWRYFDNMFQEGWKWRALQWGLPLVSASLALALIQLIKAAVTAQLLGQA